MSIKNKYGIYLSYPSRSGLYPGNEEWFITFLKSALKCNDKAIFVIACPIWSLQPLKKLLLGNSINPVHFEFIHRKQSLFNKVLRYGFGRIGWDWAYLKVKIQQRLVMISNVWIDRCLSPESWFSFFLGSRGATWGIIIKARAYDISWFSSEIPYKFLIKKESCRLTKITSQRDDISKWLVPSSSWLNSTQFKKKLVVVSDTLPLHSPRHYVKALVPNHVKRSAFLIERAEQVIIHNQRVLEFIPEDATQNDKVKYISPGVAVYPSLVDVSGLKDNVMASKILCQNIMRTIVFGNIINHPGFSYATNFIFYIVDKGTHADLLTVLKAYKRLLDDIPLTTRLLIYNSNVMQKDALIYITEHNLHQHVMWFRELSEQQIHACYSLCCFVINTSFLSTNHEQHFSRALQFGKPLITSATDETVALMRHDQNLLSHSLFDPDDYKSLSQKMRFALENTEHLVTMQNSMAKQWDVRSIDAWFNDYLKVLAPEE